MLKGKCENEKQNGDCSAFNDDGTVQYKDNKDITVGTWTEREHSILLDFNGEAESTSEPLIVTLSADKTTITVESDDSKWHPDYYQRR